MHPRKKHLAIYQHNLVPQLVFYKPGGINLKILRVGYSQLDAMMSYYSKITVVFLQLHQSGYTNHNKPVTRFFKQLKHKLENYYKCKVAYLWVREQEGASKQHYHAAIMLNGHTCQSSYIINKFAEELWAHIDRRNFSFRVKNRLYRIQTYIGDKELNAARLRLSYLAKNAGKPAGGNIQSFNSTRLRRKPLRIN